jgi:16S rRNA A1518/A1519 N6-dimethyltransferase RsmA/KsgA/DIM1 with predicted DNA glycosylase/AP lyase activity
LQIDWPQNQIRKEYGIPSVKAAWWADVTGAGSVSRSIFWPQPNVDSKLVAFVRRPTPGDEELRKKVFAIIDLAFAQRTKDVALSSFLTVWRICSCRISPHRCRNRSNTAR